MKTTLLALASLTGLAVWYSDLPIMGTVTWVQKELGISESPASSPGQKYLTAPVEDGAIRRVVTATGTLSAVARADSF